MPQAPRSVRIPTAEGEEGRSLQAGSRSQQLRHNPETTSEAPRGWGTEHAMWNPLLLLVPALLGVVAWLLALLFEWVDRRAHDPRARMPRAKAVPATGAGPRHKRSSLGDRRSEGSSPRMTPP